ncbi:MAG: NUDIX domain-containing protein [Bifidobacteriaceae bacterium]|jgi:8-oxo-dGTP diphosphatase|nr:NUDIX domain-containing protein [Bifidobacteriaceae bacterium]
MGQTAGDVPGVAVKVPDAARDAPVTGEVGLDAAGAVVWRLNGHSLEVLLVHRPRYDDWSWPKGKLKAGEDLVTCAWREVLEETGRQVVIGRPLPAVSYLVGPGRLKTVHYWAARLAADDDNPALCARPAVAIASRREIDRARWFPVQDAFRQLTMASDRPPLMKLVKYWRKQTLDTRAVVVMRHAQALERAKWPKGEATRPLTPGGRKLARRASPALAALGIRQVIASPWLRCRASVRCFARRARLAVNTSRWLTEDGAAARPARAARLMERIMSGGPPVVVCSHRPGLPTVVAVVLARGGKKVTVALGGTPLRPGEMAVAQVVVRGRRRGRVVSLERLLPGC